MRYTMFYKPGRESDGPPSDREIAALGQLIEEMTEAGVLLATEGLQSSAHGARVRCVADGFSVTEGPFPESKDLIGGYAIVAAQSKAEAIRIAKTFLTVMGEGETEIRLMEDCEETAFNKQSEEALRAALLQEIS